MADENKEAPERTEENSPDSHRSQRSRPDRADPISRCDGQFLCL